MTPVLPTTPAAWAPGDLLLVVAHQYAGGTVTMGDGSYSTLVNAGDATYGTLAIFYKIAGATETDPTLTAGGAASKFTAQIFAFRGMDPGTPIDVADSVSTQQPATVAPYTWSGASLTTTVANAMVIFAGGSRDDNTWDTWSGGISAGVYTANSAATPDNSIFMGYGVAPTAGPQAAPSANQATLGGDAGRWFTFALRPVPPPPPEGDATPNSTRPVVSIVNPVNGAVVGPRFKVQARVFSPGGVNLTSVRLTYGATTKDMTPSGYYGTTATSGVWEFEFDPAVPAQAIADGDYTMQVEASNGLAVFSRPVLVKVVTAVRGDGNLLVRDNASQLCSDCHAGIRTHSAETTDARYGSWSLACRDCHTPHSTRNLSLIRETITPPQVQGALPTVAIRFYDRRAGTNGVGDASYVDGTTPGVGVCEACHTQTEYFNRTTAGTHPDYTGKCTGCHAHTGGFRGSCTTCHGDANRTPGSGVTGTDGMLTASPPTVPDAPAVSVAGGGVHQQHVNQAKYHDKPLQCADCHLTQDATHPSNVTTVQWGAFASTDGAAVSPASGNVAGWVGAPNCTNYCHGATLADVALPASPTKVTPSWNSGQTPMNCGTCHGYPPALKHDGNPHPEGACTTCHPGYSSPTLADTAKVTHLDGLRQGGGTSCYDCHGDAARSALTGVELTDGRYQAAPPPNPAGGVHLSHVYDGTLRRPLLCDDCHTPTPTSLSHSDSIRDFGFSALAGGAGVPDPVSPTYTCSSTYCHGDSAAFTAAMKGSLTTPGWWDVSGAAKACDACHKGPPTDVYHASVPKPSTGDVCYECHDTTVNPDGSINLDGMQHVDGTFDLGGITCSSCHGAVGRTPVATATATDTNGQNLVKDAPPVDGSGLANSLQVGAHVQHANQGATAPALSNAIGCTVCHVVPTTMTHADGTALATFSGLATVRGATGATINGSNTCSSTYCHGNFPVYGLGGNAISWGTGTLAKLTCTACHVNPVTAPTYPHPGNTVSACSVCHGSGYSSTLVNATTHVDGTTNQTTYGCSQCHGVLTTASPGVASGAVNAAPGAAGSGLATTGAAVSTSTAEYGAHRAHLEQTTYTAASIPCASCHAVPATGNKAHATGVGTGGARATLTWSTLANGTVDGWSSTVPSNPVYARATGCTNVYCHGQFKNGQTGKSLVWSQNAALTCNSCHGTPGANPANAPGGGHPPNNACGNCHTGYTGTTVNTSKHLDGALDYLVDTCSACHGQASRTPVASATATDVSGQNLVKDAPPTDSHAATNGTLVGAHLQHVNQGATAPPLSNAIGCAVCHVVPTTFTHSNGTPEAVFSGLATVRGATGATIDASNTCSSTYCHGNFPVYGLGGNAISWGTGTLAKLSCTACHVNPVTVPTYPHPGNTVSACSVCHGTGYSSTVVNATVHVDGTTTQSTYGCSQCHGVLTTASPGVASGAVNAAPGAAGSGLATTGAAVSTSTAEYGAHRAHLEQTTYRAALPCASCHAVPVSGTAHATGAGTGGARATVTWSTLANGTVDGWSTSVPSSPAYARATGCTNVYCHGQFKNGQPGKTLVWSQNITLTCNSCHGTAGANPANAPGGTHPANNACGNCHTGYTGTTANTAVHIDATLYVIPMTCSSCHGSASRTPVASATATDTNGQNLVKDAPPSDSHAATNGTLVGAHVQHVNQGATPPALSNAITCAVCHVVPATTIHSNGTPEATFSGLATVRGATGATIDASNTCSSTYCHGNFPVYGLGSNPISWGTGTLNKLSCTACHVNPVTAPTYPHPANTVSACSVCHGTGYSATVVNATAHVNGTTNQTTYGCSQCHGVLTTASPGVTLAAPTNAAPGAAGSGLATTGAAISTSTAEYGAHQAHLGQNTFTAASIPCTSCHALPPSSTDKTHATGVGTGGARATLTWSTLANGTVDGWSSTVPSSPVYARATGCTNVYCHGQFKNGQTGKSLVWSQNAALTCNSCHGTAGANPANAPGGTHPANNACGNCHTGYSGTMANTTVHMNGKAEYTGSCLVCHGGAQGPRVAVAGDFVRQSRHVSNGTTTSIVTNYDCILCHTEGQLDSNGASPNETINSSPTSHGGSGGTTTVDLRDVDSPNGIGIAVAWPGNRSAALAKGSANTAYRDGMDTFCINCHDANGAATVAVNSTDDGMLTSPGFWINSNSGQTARATNVVTVNTAANHNLAVNNTVLLEVPTEAAFPPGVKTVTAIVSPTAFRYAETAANATSARALKYIRVAQSNSGSTTRASGSATVSVTTTQAHGFVAGDKVLLRTGANVTTGTYYFRAGVKTIATAPTGTTFTYTETVGTNPTSAQTSTQILLFTRSIDRAVNPFNTADTLKNARETAALQDWRWLSNGRLTDVKSAFNSSNVVGANWASHHNLNQFTKRYASNLVANWPAAAWTSWMTMENYALNGTTSGNSGQGVTAGLHCSDCHLNEANAHGSVSTWYLQSDANDTDNAFANTDLDTSTGLCAKCHAGGTYATGNAVNYSRTDAHGGDCSSGFNITSNIANLNGIGTDQNMCLGCHGGDTPGKIHGTNAPYSPGKGAVATKQYRFMGGGGSMRWYSPIGANLTAGQETTAWEGTTAFGCYTVAAADTFGGCTNHGSKYRAGGTPNRARPLTY